MCMDCSLSRSGWKFLSCPLGVAWREENQWQLSNGAAVLCELKLSTADV